MQRRRHRHQTRFQIFVLLVAGAAKFAPPCLSIFNALFLCARDLWVPLNNESGEGRIDNAGNKLFVYPSLNGIRCLLASNGETRCLCRHVCLMQVCGYIAQWLERLTADQQVPGSNPGVPFSRIRQTSSHALLVAGVVLSLAFCENW